MQIQEIKCRGKRKEDGKWIRGYLTRSSMNRPAIEVFDLDEQKAWATKYEVIPETVSLYTGLRYKDYSVEREQVVQAEKEIYCGDFILRGGTTSNGNEVRYIYLVLFEDGCFLLKKLDNTYHNGLHPSGEVLYRDYRLLQELNKEYPTFNGSYKVIGNIYDNPEILEKLSMSEISP